MKVILLQELRGRGGEGDVIDVARGFAVNYLLPRKVAIEATTGNLKQLEQRLHNIEKREDERMGDANQLVSSLEGKSVRIEAKVGEEGRLFGSVTAAMIGQAISEQLGVDIDRRKIETHGQLKEAGQFPIMISIYREVKANMFVQIVAENAAPVAAPAAPVEEDVVAEADAEAEAVETEAVAEADASSEEE